MTLMLERQPGPVRTNNDAKDFWKQLELWYRSHSRSLPWRLTQDPYKIWISEIMLQQTTVQAVIPYYEQWLAKFPNIQSLAQSSLDEVLRSWQGLGYYARARNIHKAAQKIQKDYHGIFPRDPQAIRSLPGIGRYTANAIASAAFGQAVPAVDVNLTRVIMRLFHIQKPPEDAKVLETIWRKAQSLVESSDPRIFNQAMMDLGASLCSVKRPACLICPVQDFCQSAKSRDAESIPPPKKKKAFKSITVAAAVLWNKGRVYIQQRPAHGLFGGLWEFPGGKCQKGENILQCLRREIKEETGFLLSRIQPYQAIRHSYTSFKVKLHIFEARPRQTRSRYQGRWKWVRVQELSSYAFPSANAKIIPKILHDH